MVLESMTQGLKQIDEILTDLRNFIALVGNKERMISKLHAQLVSLQKEKVNLEASLKQREADFLAGMKGKEEEITTEAMKKAQEKANVIMLRANEEVSNLMNRKESLLTMIAELEKSLQEKKVEFGKEISHIQARKQILSVEINDLEADRNKLQNIVKTMKEKLSLALE